MQCICGIHYSDDQSQWEGFLHDNGPLDHFRRYTAVYIGTCPQCATPGVKIFHFRQDESEPINPSVNSTYMSTGKIQGAQTIYPQVTRRTKPEITLQGVPASIQDSYRKALSALDSPTLYEYAVVLARRSLEATLRELGYPEWRLVDLIDGLLADEHNGFPSHLLKNINAIRNLGNIEAHEFTTSDETVLSVTKPQADWCVSIWERVLMHCYVQPAEDQAFQDRLNEDLERTGRPPLKQPLTSA